MDVLNLVLRRGAQFVSVVFHPLLVLMYMLLLLLCANPYLFGINNLAESGEILLTVFMTTFVLPAFAVMMMKWLGMIASLEMRDKQERIGPYIVTGVFYLWTFKSLYANDAMPLAFTAAVLGATIALFVAFFINIFKKISAHAVGMGGLVGLTCTTILMFSYGTFAVTLQGDLGTQIDVEIVLMAVILLSGLVGSSRLLLKAHVPDELYAGFLLGFLTQLVALKILL